MKKDSPAKIGLGPHTFKKLNINTNGPVGYKRIQIGYSNSEESVENITGTST